MKLCILGVGDERLVGRWYRGDLRGTVRLEERSALDVIVHRTIERVSGVADVTLVAPRVGPAPPQQTFDNLTRHLPLLVAAAETFGSDIIAVVVDNEDDRQRRSVLARDSTLAGRSNVALGVAEQTIEAWLLDYGAMNGALNLQPPLSGALPRADRLPCDGHESARSRFRQILQDAGHVEHMWREAAIRIAEELDLAQLGSRCPSYHQLEGDIRRVVC